MSIKIGGKFIRDSIHGDIFIEDKYLELIESSEFQRLRRIHQLSVANLVFPSAEHTRFSHSIGTFHVMKQILNHFEKELFNLNLEFNQRDKDLALAIALLHDIGHGPFSHAFEGIMDENHEEWTKKIIISKDSEINGILIKNFDENFPNELITLIDKEREVKNKGLIIDEHNEINLKFIISSLISSQLDADRIDYLLRDSMNTGVKYGNIDISRLINALKITEDSDKFYICIPEKYINDIEEYLLSRYQMYDRVYFHNFKCQMELIIEKIFKRVSETKEQENIKRLIPNELKSIFFNKKMLLKEYIELDDYMLINFFKQLNKSEDLILKNLTDCILNRKKFIELDILDNSEEYIMEFKESLKKLISTKEYFIEDFKDEYFWLETKVDNKIYKNKKDNIWILKNNGVIKDIYNISNVIERKNSKTLVFINKNLLKNLNEKLNNNEFLEQIDKLIAMYNNRTHIEIERKYKVDNKETFKLIEQYFNNIKKYSFKAMESRKQIDIYYDTDDSELLNKDITMRIRRIDNKKYVTIKTPTGSADKMDRFEYEFELKEGTKEEALNKITPYVHKEILNILKRTNEVLTVTNEREKYNLKEFNVNYELAFDDVLYKNKYSKIWNELQLEIELKSNYFNRVNLKILSNNLLKEVPGIKQIYDSKYMRGMKFTNDIN